MAASRYSNREFGDRRNPQNHYERNRTFSSTTNDHFRNKLSQIGIEKDLRELIERKKLQKDQDKNFPNTPSNDNVQKAEKKVRFEGEPLLRRSKSFSSYSTRNQEGYQRQRPSYNRFSKENNLEVPQHVHKNHRMRKGDFVDLHHPTNIKIELQTDTGTRKYTVDSSVPIPDIKCNLKQSRTLSKHTEPKESFSLQQESGGEIKNVRMRGSGNFRGTTRRSFNKKNKENKGQNSSQNNENENDLAISNVVESLSNLEVSNENEK
ncbi:hypothetical protein WA026_014033 [Henosepilachna vigintioctopunctata]|uniref:Uncharacterized protein n=1 Tax=Henosepilachna vigintioctopunctata TaxID=420089 RepID=A0AAW1U6M4_9CUCU